MTTPRVSCQVIALALVPRKPGERVKTNRRDARKLAERRRAGLLTEVRPPTPEVEAVRDPRLNTSAPFSIRRLAEAA